MFKEKTAAYKILGGIEKAMHIAKLAMDAKEFITKLGFLSSGVAARGAAEGAETGLAATGAAARTALSIPEMIAKMYAQLGIFGPIGIALALAAIAGAGGKAGGFTATSAQLQETQGTGQRYNSEGKLENYGAGVLGDRSAINADIVNSIEGL